MSDGVHLAGRLWRPADSDERPVPAILEFIPYRQRDLTAVRDSMHHPYLAGHGFAGVRVDLRGSGDSEGVLTDEYLEQELRDAEEVLAWLAAQPWCDGRTGMMGISWGGFNALQVAARRPPSLGADRHGLVHRRPVRRRRALHGRLPADRQPVVGVDDVRLQLLPARPGGGRRELAGDVARSGCAAAGSGWRSGCATSTATTTGGTARSARTTPRSPVPVLAVSGWADGYTNAVFRLLAALDVPRKGLIGPWSHKYPHLGQPGPAVGFLQELVRWWDHWLRDVDNGVMDEPMLRIWMQDSVPPSTAYAERPGRWVGEASWPSPQVSPAAHPLGDHRILDPDQQPAEVHRAAQGAVTTVRGPVRRQVVLLQRTAGSALRPARGGRRLAGLRRRRCSPSGWRSSVRRWWTWSSPSTGRSAMVAVRLSDVAPDGRATRISYGLRNLTHRDGHDHPSALVPGERLPGAGGPQRDGTGVATRPSAAAGVLDVLLAPGLAARPSRSS